MDFTKPVVNVLSRQEPVEGLNTDKFPKRGRGPEAFGFLVIKKPLFYESPVAIIAAIDWGFAGGDKEATLGSIVFYDTPKCEDITAVTATEASAFCENTLRPMLTGMGEDFGCVNHESI